MRVFTVLFAPTCLGALLLPALNAQPVEFPEPNYCFAFLNAVPNRPDLPEKEAMDIQKQHLAHLQSLWQRGWLQAAGPILTPGGPRGVLISTCKSVEEANELASADPAVKQKRLFVESHRWTGPEGIGEQYRKAKAADPNGADKMIKYSLVMLRRSATWRDWPPKNVFESHIASVMGLLQSGKVVAAGPIHGGDKWLGVFVFQNTALDDARKTIEGDPMVKGGFATVEAYEWMASDSLFPGTK